MKKRLCAFVIVTALCSDMTVFAQEEVNRVISTTVPFLTISTDSRGSALGDAGVANTPNANSLFWNTATLAGSSEKFGASLSYSPWLHNITQDLGLTSLNAFFKPNEKQAITAGFTYFDQGTIEFTDNQGNVLGNTASRESAFILGIAQQLGSNLSIGLNGKYINSNLLGNIDVQGATAKSGRTAAFDIGLLYARNTLGEAKKIKAAYGVNIQNIGGKISYGFRELYIPTNLKFGTRVSFHPDAMNRFSFLLDFNKLLVPTPKGDESDSTLADQGLFEAMFSSFGDSGSFGNEIKEISAHFGVEYMYANLFALRLGYFGENKNAGNRRGITAGAGVTLKKNFVIDLSYLIPSGSSGVLNPLSNTWRFSLHTNLGNFVKEEK